MTDSSRKDPAAGSEDVLRASLRALAVRVEAARRLTPPAGAAVLQSVVDAAVALFGAEAASIALHDPTTDQLVFEVAAGQQGEGVIGVSIATAEGVAGYVFSTAQPIALSDVARDARFGRAAAEQTGYVPRSLIAVPLADDDGVAGVLEILDKRGDGGFDLRDLELAGVFARQATIAIRSSRVERDTAALLRSVVTATKTGVATAAAEPVDADVLVSDAIAELAAGDDALWRLADEIARLRAADPAQLDLVRELLAVLTRRAERERSTRGTSRPR